MTTLGAPVAVGDSGAGARRPEVAAAHLAARAVLNCFVRESDGWTVDPPDGPATAPRRLTVEVPGGRVEVGVRYWSPTLRHQFSLPARLVSHGDVDGRGAPLDTGALLRLLLGALAGPSPDTDAVAPGDPGLEARVRDSEANLALFLTARADDVDRLWHAGPLPFIDTEQGLLVGHMVHPTAKSRDAMPDGQLAALSPELAASFPLRWFLARRELVEHDSATGTPAPELARRLLLDDPALDRDALESTVAERVGPGALDDADWVLVPAHPFEADHLRADPELAGLFGGGHVVDLGAWGTPFRPTTSVRTVWRADAAWMCKFSLHVRVTNSQRVTLPKELHRAVESARWLDGPVGRRAAAVAPSLVLLPDPAFLTVRWEGRVVDGFSVILRRNRWPARGAASDDVTALTTLCQDWPYGWEPPPGPGAAAPSSRLGQIVRHLAAQAGRPVEEVGREWFARFADAVVSPLVQLYLDVGLCFEAHQQNTLVELDDGWPVRGVYRDSQGYFHREAAHEDLAAEVPGIGEATESIFPEALADERLAYYLFVNQALGVVNALGTAGVADEAVLLADLRRRLDRHRRHGGRYPATLLDTVLDPPRLPCKGNLRTRLHGMDELVGDIATQSVYVTIPNPLAPPALDGRVRLVPVDPEADADLVARWMGQPHARPWWEVEATPAAARAYLEAQAALDHLEPWIAHVDGRPVAYVETYRVADDPLAAHHPFAVGDRGWHVLAGPAEELGSGRPQLVGRAVLALLFADPGCDAVWCEPDERNERMLRFCAGLGHDEVARLDLPDKRAALLVCRRDRWQARFVADAGGRPPAEVVG